MKKRKRREDKRKREERKKREKKGKMVGDQTANQAAKPLMKGEKEKKKNHQFWNGRIAVSYVNSLVSSPVCVCLLGMLGAL
jgi:hypothetical protein